MKKKYDRSFPREHWTSRSAFSSSPPKLERHTTWGVVRQRQRDAEYLFFKSIACLFSHALLGKRNCSDTAPKLIRACRSSSFGGNAPLFLHPSPPKPVIPCHGPKIRDWNTFGIVVQDLLAPEDLDRLVIPARCTLKRQPWHKTEYPRPEDAGYLDYFRPRRAKCPLQYPGPE